MREGKINWNALQIDELIKQVRRLRRAPVIARCNWYEILSIKIISAFMKGRGSLVISSEHE